jgi:hypothetical protein
LGLTQEDVDSKLFVPLDTLTLGTDTVVVSVFALQLATVGKAYVVAGLLVQLEFEFELIGRVYW